MNGSREHAVLGSIDRQRITDDLRALVAIPSVTGGEEEVQAELGRRMTAAGLEVRAWTVDPAQVARDPDFPGAEVERSTLPLLAGRVLGPGDAEQRVLLVGHVDVVPAGDRALWTSDPFVPTERDGALYGRGACDMKGGVVAALAAIRALAENGVRPERDVVLLSVPSEEDGGSGMLAAIRDGYTAACAVITEPTGLEVVTTTAGAITFRLTITGRAAHASMRREGVSALDKLAVVVRALEEDERVRNEAETEPLMRALGLPYPTIIGKVNGGEWASTVLDRLVVEGRYGVRVGQTARDAERDLRAVLERAAADDPWLREHPPGFEVTGGRFSSAVLPPSHPLPVGLVTAAERALGRRPRCVGVPYGADMRLLLNEGATPTVIFGPGDIRVAHAPDEHVRLDEVVDCARALAAWLMETTGAA